MVEFPSDGSRHGEARRSLVRIDSALALASIRSGLALVEVGDEVEHDVGVVLLSVES
jgi:hypothetical protein